MSRDNQDCGDTPNRTGPPDPVPGRFQRVFAFLFGNGMRKVTVLGTAMAVAELAAVVALFTGHPGHMTATEFSSFTIEVLQWGGGIFTLGNVVEHGTKAVTAVVQTRVAK